MYSYTLPEILKEKRNALGYTQSETADLLFITRSTYNHYEKGERTPPVEVLVRIAQLYKMNPLDFIAPLIPPEYLVDIYLPLQNLHYGYSNIQQKNKLLVTTFNSLDIQEQNLIISLMQSLSKNKIYAETSTLLPLKNPAS